MIELDDEEEDDEEAEEDEEVEEIEQKTTKEPSSRISGKNTDNSGNKGLEDEDVMEIADEDPFSEVVDSEDKSEDGQGTVLNMKKVPAKEANNESSSGKDDQVTIVVNDTKSLVELANSKKEPGKEPTLVIIDTNAILSGKGPVPLEKSSSTPSTKSQHHHQDLTHTSSRNSSVTSNAGDNSYKYSNAYDIPDDAFLIEAPSFIVPYVFEHSGEKSLKEAMKDLDTAMKKDKEAKVASGDDVVPEDDIVEKKPSTDNYFEGPVGKLLMNVGMSLVQEFVQTDLLKMQKRKAEKEKDRSRSKTVSMETQQSIISLRKNLEESKENNEPFRYETKKCTFCNFKTESSLVMSAHLETPHMRNYSYRCNFCEYTTRVPHEILFHMEAEHMVMPRLERYGFFFIYNLPNFFVYVSYI